MPVVASNRIGTETFQHSHITFYGGSFIAGPAGEIVAQVGLACEDWLVWGRTRCRWVGAVQVSTPTLHRLQTLAAAWRAGGVAGGAGQPGH